MPSPCSSSRSSHLTPPHLTPPTHPLASFGRFFYRFPNGESGADVYDRCARPQREIAMGRGAVREHWLPWQQGWDWSGAVPKPPAACPLRLRSRTLYPPLARSMTIFEDHLVRDINAGRFSDNTSLVLVTHGALPPALLAGPARQRRPPGRQRHAPACCAAISA